MRTAAICVISMLALATSAARARDTAWSAGGGAWLLGEFVWRGVSQTQEKPALQGEAYLEHESGAFGGLWVSSIDYTAPGEAADGIDHELDAYVGWAGDLGAERTLELTLTQVRYPGHAADADYEYREVEATLGLGGGTEVGVAYSPDIVNLGGRAIYYRAQHEWPPSADGVVLRAGLGYFDLDAVAGDGYFDWTLALTRDFGAIRAELQYTDTASYGAALSEALDDAALADARLVLSLGMSF